MRLLSGDGAGACLLGTLWPSALRNIGLVFRCPLGSFLSFHECCPLAVRAHASYFNWQPKSAFLHKLVRRMYCLIGPTCLGDKGAKKTKNTTANPNSCIYRDPFFQIRTKQNKSVETSRQSEMDHILWSPLPLSTVPALCELYLVWKYCTHVFLRNSLVKLNAH